MNENFNFSGEQMMGDYSRYASLQIKTEEWFNELQELYCKGWSCLDCPFRKVSEYYHQLKEHETKHIFKDCKKDCKEALHKWIRREYESDVKWFIEVDDNSLFDWRLNYTTTIEPSPVQKPSNENMGKALKELTEKLIKASHEINSPYLELNYYNCLQNLVEAFQNPVDLAPDISALKKRIKYCKNPMERKSLEKQLDTAYKQEKKRRQKV